MLTAEQAWKILEEADLVCSADEVDRAIERVAGELVAEFRDKYPLVLCVMSGAVFFCARLLPLLRFPLHLGYVHASRYGEHIDGRHVRWKVEPGDEVKDRVVLVVDDILDAGDTLAEIKAKVMARGATSCKVAVLTDKIKPTPKPIAPDFVGLRIPDRFVFGCGLDAYGLWRNLPAIYALRQG
ncbi:MAG TPA: hypoxanthine-guanine phosphoribosyltransferase [Burkholderiales bacterium]|nr:hypoxanthine-guanine phosphoribosyltransferase [Burkholderiales bacterium]